MLTKFLQNSSLPYVVLQIGSTAFTFTSLIHSGLFFMKALENQMYSVVFRENIKGTVP